MDLNRFMNQGIAQLVKSAGRYYLNNPKGIAFLAKIAPEIKKSATRRRRNGPPCPAADHRKYCVSLQPSLRRVLFACDGGLFRAYRRRDDSRTVGKNTAGSVWPGGDVCAAGRRGTAYAQRCDGSGGKLPEHGFPGLYQCDDDGSGIFCAI